MWHKILKTRKSASRIEVEEAYKKLINNPNIYLDANKKLEIDNAYKAAIAHFKQIENLPKESFFFFKFTIFIAVIAIIFTLLSKYDFLHTVTKEVTIKECLESGKVVSNNINHESIKDSLVENEYIIDTYEIASNSNYINASKETSNGTVQFSIYSNDETGSGQCYLLISKESESEYKDTTASIIQKLIKTGEGYSQVHVSIFVTGGRDIFSPFYITNKTVKANAFDSFEIKDKDDYPELEDYLDEEFYKASNDILEEEYNSLTK